MTTYLDDFGVHTGKKINEQPFEILTETTVFNNITTEVTKLTKIITVFHTASFLRHYRAGNKCIKFESARKVYTGTGTLNYISYIVIVIV